MMDIKKLFTLTTICLLCSSNVSAKEIVQGKYISYAGHGLIMAYNIETNANIYDVRKKSFIKTKIGDSVDFKYKKVYEKCFFDKKCGLNVWVYKNYTNGYNSEDK